MERSKKGKLMFFFRSRTSKVLSKVLVVMICLNMTFWGFTTSVFAEVPPSLKTVPVPEPFNLDDFVKSRLAAQILGKALFWDQQVGSDGQACASCHFHAGADNRTRNQISPGFIASPPDITFQVAGPNEEVVAADFPFFQVNPPDERRARAVVVRNANDVMSSQGVFRNTFTGINPDVTSLFDLGTPVPDDLGFSIGGSNTRRVEPRNTPTVINAVFTFSNFFDGRARNIFNGRNPFGELDIELGPDHQIFVNDGAPGADPVLETVRIPDASLASQAVGPPGNPIEMSFAGRTFPEIGRKLLARTPLGHQSVHPNDTLLGLFSASPANGLTISYADLIRAAFQDRFWNGADVVIDIRGLPTTFSQMEANFSLFFGLAAQLYEATLVSDDSKFDQVQERLAVFTPEEKDGLNTFNGAGKCFDCHAGPEFTSHTLTHFGPAVAPGVTLAAIERMNMARGKAFYDSGMYNISVRPTLEDVGRGGNSPFTNPATGAPFPLAFSRLAVLKAAGLLPAAVAAFVPDLPGVVPGNRVAVDGAFKTATLRNAELTGPYFHAGQQSTLRQVVEFYTRGGNFPVENIDNLDPLIRPIGKLRGKPDRQNNLVAFMLTLTDERVRNETGPFDHPSLSVPAGDGLQDQDTGVIIESFILLPAVGANGLPAEGLPPIGTFLDLSPFDQGTP